MTIAAGFCTRDGIVLCADTMMTSAMRTYESKIFPYSIDGESYAFALAGHELYGKMAIDECREAVASVAVEKRTVRTVRKAIAKAIKEIFENHIDLRPESERPDAQIYLLIAAWIPKDGGTHLFSTLSTAVTERLDCDCIGSGYYLGNFLIRPVFQNNMPMQEAILLATHALSAAKTYDVNCGGASQFVILRSDGSITNEISPNTAMSEQFILDL